MTTTAVEADLQVRRGQVMSKKDEIREKALKDLQQFHVLVRQGAGVVQRSESFELREPGALPVPDRLGRGRCTSKARAESRCVDRVARAGV